MLQGVLGSFLFSVFFVLCAAVFCISKKKSLTQIQVLIGKQGVQGFLKRVFPKHQMAPSKRFYISCALWSSVHFTNTGAFRPKTKSVKHNQMQDEAKILKIECSNIAGNTATYTCTCVSHKNIHHHLKYSFF